MLTSTLRQCAAVLNASILDTTHHHVHRGVVPGYAYGQRGLLIAMFTHYFQFADLPWDARRDRFVIVIDNAHRELPLAG